VSDTPGGHRPRAPLSGRAHASDQLAVARGVRAPVNHATVVPARSDRRGRLRLRLWKRDDGGEQGPQMRPAAAKSRSARVAPFVSSADQAATPCACLWARSHCRLAPARREAELEVYRCRQVAREQRGALSPVSKTSVRDGWPERRCGVSWPWSTTPCSVFRGAWAPCGALRR